MSPLKYSCAAATLALVVALASSRGVAQESESDSLVALVLGLLQDEDKDIRALAFEQVRTDAPGAAATRKFAGALAGLPPESQVGLLRALADRADPAAHDAVAALMESSDASVRVAAVEALGPLGSAADVKALGTYLTQSNEELRAAARTSLEHLPGDEASAAMAAQIKTGPAEQRIAMIEVLAVRRAKNELDHLADAALDADPQVRAAAMVALGQIGTAEEIPGMIQAVLKAERGRERSAAEKGVMFVTQRDDAAAAAVIKDIRQRTASERQALLPMLGRIGGPEAHRIVEEAIASRDAQEHRMGITALANWPDAAIAPRLIELATQDAHASHRRTMLRALVRVAPLPDDRTDEERLALLKEAMGMCQEDADRMYVLQRASAVRLPATLQFVLPYVKETKFSEQACLTIVELAHHRTLREQDKEAFHAALDEVMRISKNKTVVERARRYKNNQTWVR